MRRILYPAALGLALCFPVLGSFQADAASSYAGHWKAQLAASCANASGNAKVCAFVLGHFPAIGKIGTQITEGGVDQFTVAANGKYADAGSETLQETVPSSRVKGCPTAAKLGTTLFTGSCVLTWSGNGHVVMKSGTPVFYTDSVTLRYQGKLLGTEKGASANSGLPTPAKAGRYNAAWAAHQAGAKSVPAGFAFQAVITRS